MALYLNQNETRTQLSSKVSAHLSQRLNKRSLDDAGKPAVIMQNQRKTTNGGLFWSLVVAFVVIGIVIYLIFFF